MLKTKTINVEDKTWQDLMQIKIQHQKANLSEVVTETLNENTQLHDKIGTFYEFLEGREKNATTDEQRAAYAMAKCHMEILFPDYFKALLTEEKVERNARKS